MNVANVFDPFDDDLDDYVDVTGKDKDDEFVNVNRRVEPSVMQKIEIYFEEENLQLNITEVF